MIRRDTCANECLCKAAVDELLAHITPGEWRKLYNMGGALRQFAVDIKYMTDPDRTVGSITAKTPNESIHAKKVKGVNKGVKRKAKSREPKQMQFRLSPETIRMMMPYGDM